MTTDRRNFIYIYKSLYLERKGNRFIVSLSRAKITSTDSFPKTVRLGRRRILLMKTHAESGTSCNTDASRDDDDVDCFCSAVSIWPIFALNGCIVDLYSSSRAGNLL